MKKLQLLELTAKFGKMELNDVAYVPSFSKNLVSGIQIMKEGQANYRKQHFTIFQKQYFSCNWKVRIRNRIIKNGFRSSRKLEFRAFNNFNKLQKYSFTAWTSRYQLLLETINATDVLKL